MSRWRRGSQRRRSCRRCWPGYEERRIKRRRLARDMNLLSEFKEGMGISWDAIRANKMRSLLTTLGIVIGVVTVTLMGTAIEGLNRAFMKSISFIGADVLYVQRFSWFNHSHE